MGSLGESGNPGSLSMTLCLYSLLMWCLQPLVRARLRWRARSEPVYGQRMEERFGDYGPPYEWPQSSLDSDRFFVWVHAVSLGETRAAEVLVAQLRHALPGMRLLLTHGTATGHTQGASLLREGDVQVWQPWDSAYVVRRFLLHFKPRVGLLLETEVWPNLVAVCAQLKVPLCLVNARLSEKSQRQALRLAWLSRPAYAGLRAVWAQTQADAQRLYQVGAPVLGVTGNLKFDATPNSVQLEHGRLWRSALARPVIVFASSREGEEAILLKILKDIQALALVESAESAIQRIAKDVQWLIVPRHPQRFDAVADLCRAQGFSVSRRSQWSNVPQPADIWLGDSLGEMAMFFGLSDVALLGGSFAPLGGQNLIEAAACGCPVVMGPHTFNFAHAAQLAIEAGAAFREGDMPHAVNKALALLCVESEFQKTCAAAQALSMAHRGAAKRTATALQNIIAASTRAT